MVTVTHCSPTTCTFKYGTQKVMTSDLLIIVSGMVVRSFIQPDAYVNITSNSLPVMNSSTDIIELPRHFKISHNGAKSKFLVI